MFKFKNIIYHFLLVIILVVGAQLVAQAENDSIKRPITVSATVGIAVEASVEIQNWFNGFENAPNSGNYIVTNSSDYDGDGQLDYLEYYAGTDPTDGTAFLKTLMPEFIIGRPVIFWDSSASDVPESRVYHVFRCGPDGLNVLANPNASIASLQSQSSIITDLGEVNSQGTITSLVDSDSDINDFPLFYRVFLVG